MQTCLKISSKWISPLMKRHEIFTFNYLSLLLLLLFIISSVVELSYKMIAGSSTPLLFRTYVFNRVSTSRSHCRSKIAARRLPVVQLLHQPAVSASRFYSTYRTTDWAVPIALNTRYVDDKSQPRREKNTWVGFTVHVINHL